MNTEEINLLLSKYYEGESSLEEEKQLRELFLSGNYPPEFAQDARVFIYYGLSTRKRINDPDFEKEMDDLLLSIPNSTHRWNPRRIPWLAAATILILAGLFLTFRQIHRAREESIPVNTTELAYEQFQTAILHLSSNFNSGLGNLQHLNVYTRAIGTIDHLSNNYQYQILTINNNENNNSQNQKHEKVN